MKPTDNIGKGQRKKTKKETSKILIVTLKYLFHPLDLKKKKKKKTLKEAALIMLTLPSLHAIFHIHDLGMHGV